MIDKQLEEKIEQMSDDQLKNLYFNNMLRSKGAYAIIEEMDSFIAAHKDDNKYSIVRHMLKTHEETRAKALAVVLETAEIEVCAGHRYKEISENYFRHGYGNDHVMDFEKKYGLE
jgi:hypothetical protein